MPEPCPCCDGPSCVLEVSDSLVATAGCKQAYLRRHADEKECVKRPTVFSEAGRDDAIERWNSWCKAQKGKG